MADINYQEFLDQFENTAYPFVDGASLTDVTGTFTIPASLFLDASLYLPNTQGNLYISKIQIGMETVEITISEEGSTQRASVFITGTSGAVCPVIDTVGHTVGCICSEGSRLSFFKACGSGSYTFLPSATRFAARCVFPDPGLGVMALSSGSDSLSGEVWLVGGEGVRLSTSGNTIRIDITGDVLHKMSSCDTTNTELFETKNYLRTINNLPPDIYGNISIGQIYNSMATPFRVVSDASGTTIKEL